MSSGFQKLLVWQKSMELVKFIYELTKDFPKEEIYGITSQLRRSAISIPSNISEGSERTTNKDFSNFLKISKGSLAELETQLLIIQDLKYTKNIKLLEKSLNLTLEIRKMISGLIKSLNSNL